MTVNMRMLNQLLPSRILKARHGGTCLQSQLLGRLRQEDAEDSPGYIVRPGGRDGKEREGI
jgi:hypothetical protein